MLNVLFPLINRKILFQIRFTPNARYLKESNKRTRSRKERIWVYWIIKFLLRFSLALVIPIVVARLLLWKLRGQQNPHRHLYMVSVFSLSVCFTLFTFSIRHNDVLACSGY